MIYMPSRELTRLVTICLRKTQIGEQMWRRQMLAFLCSRRQDGNEPSELPSGICSVLFVVIIFANATD
jgi:hypothetical protein